MLSARIRWMLLVGMIGRPAWAFVGRRSNISVHALSMVGTEVPSLATRAVSNSSHMLLDPLVVCGPSGVGKGTIINKYMEEHGGKELFGFTVSHTTRSPRPGEVHGIHYHFLPYSDMEKEIQQGGFLEYAQVHGNLYGTSWASVRDVQLRGKRCLLDIDVQGVRKLRSLEDPSMFQPKYVFIAPPSLEVLERRLVSRGTESPESLERRTKNARDELDYGLYDGNFDSVVINDDLEEACRNFAKAIRTLYPDIL